MHYVIWSKDPLGWLTKQPGIPTILRQEAAEFAEGHPRLANARNNPDLFQIYPVRSTAV